MRTESASERLARYAELTVRVGVNLDAEQQLGILAQSLEHAPLARAIARAAYEQGASYVYVYYDDPHVRHALLACGPDDSLSWSAPSLRSFMDRIADRRRAFVIVNGDPEPALFGKIQEERVGMARAVEFERRFLGVLNDGQEDANCTVIAYPTEGWAQSVFGEPDVERLWEVVMHTTRLDEPDPYEAWRKHIAFLERRADALTKQEFDAVRFRGPGTELTVGLQADSVWRTARRETAWGREFVANVPTEEVMTVPDRLRTEGVVRATRPLATTGMVVRDLEIEFIEGRAASINASSNEGAVVGQCRLDDGACYLGEVALVDGNSRVGRTRHTFMETLHDENATCHLAYGNAYPYATKGLTGLPPEELLERGVNVSAVHTDFMVGGAGVEVDGLANGRATPLIRDEAWLLDETEESS
jgi:aminopeptidase